MDHTDRSEGLGPGKARCSQDGEQYERSSTGCIAWTHGIETLFEIDAIFYCWQPLSCVLAKSPFKYLIVLNGAGGAEIEIPIILKQILPRG